MTIRKIKRSMSAIMPSWMLAMFAVCLVIPGPFDEIAMVVAALFLCAVQPVRFRRAVSAFKGGKSHRRHDLSAA